MASFQVTSMDPNELKKSLIEFMKAQDTVQDYNFEGSAINTIIDLLVRNTHYSAYLTNMMSNESFLDSAQLRASVVSHANKLNYTPKSRTTATAIVDVTVTPTDNNSLPENIVMPKGTLFLSTFDNKTYQFVTTKDHYLYKWPDDTYQGKNIEIKQGANVKNTTVYSGGPLVIEIPNSNIDTSTLVVKVQNSVSDPHTVAYYKADDITKLDYESRVYFLSENHKGLYQVEFGDGVLGKTLEAGNIITVDYVATEDVIAQYAKVFNCASPIVGYSTIQTTTVQPASGGAERESIASIKLNAPRVYATQARAVTPRDYEALTLKDFPDIKSAQAWGGEDNIPPSYGDVFISLIPHADFALSSYVKSMIENKLKTYAVGSIRPVIVDTEYFYIDLTVKFGFDPTRTNLTFAELSSYVSQTAFKYDVDELSKFSRSYNNSKLVSRILEDDAITTIQIDKRIRKTLPVLQTAATKYEIQFSNPLVKGSIRVDDATTSATADVQYIEDKDGVLTLYTLENGITTPKDVGTVNYSTGYVEFTGAFTVDDLNVFCTPQDDNFKASNRNVCVINNVVTEQIKL